MSKYCDIDFFCYFVVECEWQVQECVMYVVCIGEFVVDDVCICVYCQIDVVLCVDDVIVLFVDFVEQFVVKVGCVFIVVIVLEIGLEKQFICLLLVVFVIVGFVVVVFEGGSWFYVDLVVWLVVGNLWVLVLLVCLGVLQGVEWLWWWLG